MKEKTKNIGIKVNPPTEKCTDQHCPFHGRLKVKGKIFTGKVISYFHKTVTIEFPRLFFLPKYERHEKRRTRIKAHNPPCIDAKSGDSVKIMECRPLSKTKNFVIIEKISKNESR